MRRSCETGSSCRPPRASRTPITRSSFFAHRPRCRGLPSESPQRCSGLSSERLGSFEKTSEKGFAAHEQKDERFMMTSSTPSTSSAVYQLKDIHFTYSLGELRVEALK